jgi:hypothetical protein
MPVASKMEMASSTFASPFSVMCKERSWIVYGPWTQGALSMPNYLSGYWFGLDFNVWRVYLNYAFAMDTDAL